MTNIHPLLKSLIDIELPNIEIMDIGAMYEARERYSIIVEQGLANVTGFEPNPSQYAILATREGPCKYLPYFLGTGKAENFNITRYPGCSSLLEPDPTVIDLFSGIGAGQEKDNFHVVSTKRVATKRLDDITGINQPDFIKIDVQGFELDILKHGVKTLENTLVVETEVEFIPLYKEQPLFCDIQSFFREQGFVLHKLTDVSGRMFRPIHSNNPFEPMSQILWADAIFVRSFLSLEKYSDLDLLKTALIMNDIYYSYDFVYFLLQEYDKRNNTTLKVQYFKIFNQSPKAQPNFINVKS